MATEKDHLLSPSSYSMLAQSPIIEESVASHSLFVDNAAEMEGGPDGPATQRWEIVIVYPNVLPNTFTSPEDNNKQQKRDALVGQLRDVGLFVSQRESSDTKQTFLLLGASEAKCEEFAEFIGLELTLKVWRVWHLNDTSTSLSISISLPLTLPLKSFSTLSLPLSLSLSLHSLKKKTEQ